MIKLSSEHKTQIRAILSQHGSVSLDATIKQMAPILSHYCSVDPQKLGNRLLRRLFDGWLSKENEAIVHYWTICKSVFEYGYPPEQVDIEVPCGGMGRQALSPQLQTGTTFADVVLYSHESRRPGTASVVIECRELGGPDGVKQAASYARALQAKHHLFTDSAKWNAFETQPHPIDGLPISDIPHWVGSKPLASRLPKSHILPPITDEKQLRDLVRFCHDAIHSEGVDPAKSFDELVKLLFVKVYDEQEIPNVYEFSVLAGESADDTGNHIRELLRQARQKSRYKELFSEPGDDEFAVVAHYRLVARSRL